MAAALICSAHAGHVFVSSEDGGVVCSVTGAPVESAAPYPRDGRRREQEGERLGLGLRGGFLLVRVALLAPGVGMDVVSPLLPEPARVAVRELQAAEPLRALPRVALRHDQPEREPVIGLER